MWEEAQGKQGDPTAGDLNLISTLFIQSLQKLHPEPCALPHALLAPILDSFLHSLLFFLRDVRSGFNSALLFQGCRKNFKTG